MKWRSNGLVKHFLKSRNAELADNRRVRSGAFRWRLGFGFSLAALAMVAGCAVGPNYKRPPAATIPPAYTGATNVVATDSGATNGWKVAQPQAQFPKGDWWQIFDYAELNDM